MPRNNQPVYTKLSSKHQTVIPQVVRDALELRPGDEVAWHIQSDGKKQNVILLPKPKSWANYMRGLGKDVWKGIDTDAYINALRDEWDRKK